MFTLYKMIFYLKFLSLTVKVGQNKNKIGDKKKKKKTIMNLLTEL